MPPFSFFFYLTFLLRSVQTLKMHHSHHIFSQIALNNITTPPVCRVHSSAHVSECELLKAESIISIKSVLSSLFFPEKRNLTRSSKNIEGSG